MKVEKIIAEHEKFLTKQFRKMIEMKRRGIRFDKMPRLKYKEGIDKSVMV